jgi:EAL domain-containing protein (putative c-di-GMP-specific phosphodiesterase class I)
MLNQLGMKTLCKGVETKEQSDFLRESGCAVQQGYYYYKPVSREEFENILDKNA